MKFILIFSEEGKCNCYEWPLRGDPALFSLRLHQKEITNAILLRGSILVTCSDDQLLVSNLRYLLPSSAVFG